MNQNTAIRSISLPAPAKINLLLSVGGRRIDGFHEIFSLMAKIDLCDLVTVERYGAAGDIECICLGNEALSGETNLASHCVKLWRDASGWNDGIRITIHKRIPVMAGLGGGSSDAVATLKALNLMSGKRMSFRGMKKIAASLGSDCVSFLMDGPCIASGRGEEVEPLSDESNERLRDAQLFLFKPPIGFCTADMYDRYSRLKENPAGAPRIVEGRNSIMAWEGSEKDVTEILRNDLQRVAVDKYRFITPLFQMLNERFGLHPLLSGSGSCCFAFLPPKFQVEQAVACVKGCWGNESFVFVGKIRG